MIRQNFISETPKCDVLEMNLIFLSISWLLFQLGLGDRGIGKLPTTEHTAYQSPGTWLQLRLVGLAGSLSWNLTALRDPTPGGKLPTAK